MPGRTTWTRSREGSASERDAPCVLTKDEERTMSFFFLFGIKERYTFDISLIRYFFFFQLSPSSMMELQITKRSFYLQNYDVVNSSSPESVPF